MLHLRRIQKTLRKVLIIIVGSIITFQLYAESNIDKRSTKEQYLKTIDFIEKNAEDIYCYWDIKREQYQVDWRELVKEARNKINENTSLEEFQMILTEMASKVHDGHVNFIYTSKNKIFYIPFSIKRLGNNYYIDQVEQDKMAPNQVDLEPGDKLVAINGVEIETYIKEKSKYISASTIGAQKEYATAAINTLEKFKSSPEGNLRLTIAKYSRDETISVELPWIIYDRSELPKKSVSEIVHSQILPGNIGLLKIQAMSAAEDVGVFQTYIKDAMQSLKKTNALIIDVRNNGGGAGEIGDTINGHFVTRSITRYKAQIKNSHQLFYARPELMDIFNQTDPSQYEFSEWEDYKIEPINESHPAYANPVYILTNQRCFSACDTFVDAFSSNHLGKVLGAQTGGGTGSPLWFELPWNFGHFRFSILRGYSGHDRYLEGVGTIPDVELSTNVKAIHQKLDGELIEAFNYIKKDLGINKFAQLKMDNSTLQQYFSTSTSEIIPYHLEEALRQKLQ